MDKGQEAREALIQQIMDRHAEYMGPPQANYGHRAVRAMIAEALASHAPAIGGEGEVDGIMCGGCGAMRNSQRCIGCLHDFGTPESAWVRKHRAALAPPIPEAARVEGWNPIGTAPTDREIDLWVGVGVRIADCRWGKPTQANWGDRHGADKDLPAQWITRAGTALDRRNGPATHWREKPTPPSEASHGGETASGEVLARRFHETYEQLAPSFGYETRPETREFDPASPNGRLMIAVCAALASPGDSVDGQGEGR